MCCSVGHLSPPRVQVSAPALAELSGTQLADQTLPALEKLLGSDPQLVGKKSLYVRLGSRGDWCAALCRRGRAVRMLIPLAAAGPT